jgi:hypothetical protein
VVKPASVVVKEVPVEVDIVVRAQAEVDTIEGLVVDESGAPVADAQIHTQAAQGAFSARTKADGTFRLERGPSEPADPIRLSILRGGYEPGASDGSVPWGTRDVMIVLRAGLSVELQVLDARTRRPLEEFGVRCFRASSERRSTSVRDAGRHPAGTLVLKGLTRGTWCLVVEPVSDEWMPSRVVDFEVTDAGAPLQVVELHPRQRRTVRVVRTDGAPVGGSVVELLEPLSGREPDLRSWPWRWGDVASRNNALLVHRGTTDAAGEVVLSGPPDRDLSLRALGPGHQPVLRTGLRWIGDAEPIVLQVPAGARLLGTIGPLAALRRFDQSAKVDEFHDPGPLRDEVVRRSGPKIRLRRGEGTVREFFPPAFGSGGAITAQGDYEITGVPAGTWRVLLDASQWTPQSSRTDSRDLGSVELRDGESTRFDYVLPAPGRARVKGTVLRNGASCVGSTGELRETAAAAAWVRKNVSFETDEKGRFAVELEPGTYRLGLFLPGERPPFGTTLPALAELTLADGEEREAVF